MSGNSILTNSELAMSSYSTLVGGNSINQVGAFEQNGKGLSEFQAAQQFAEKFPTIIGQYEDSSSGFNVTAFRSVGGDISLAFRGTESTRANDLGADLQLFSRGAAIDQIISMYNWWQLVSATPGQPVSSIQSFTIGVDTLPNNAVHVLSQQFYLVPESAIATGVPGSSGPVSILSLDTDGDPFYATAGLHLTEAEKCRENWWRFRHILHLLCFPWRVDTKKFRKSFWSWNVQERTLFIQRKSILGFKTNTSAA